MVKVGLLVLGSLAVAIFSVYLSFISPIDPAFHPYQQGPALTGVYSPNNSLSHTTKLALNQVHGPEDIVFDDDGNLFTGTLDGWIKVVYVNGTVGNWAYVGGRPLGLDWSRKNEELFVCEPSQGLLLVTKTSVQLIANEADGVPFKFIDAVTVARSGKVYFTDASYKFSYHQLYLDFLEARPHGRLLEYDPQTMETTVLVKDLHFANGVALSRREDFLLIAESSRYRIKRFWIEGDKAGKEDIFLQNLPGFPDNIKSNGDGSFWIALYTSRSSLLDYLHTRPLLKSICSSLPLAIWKVFGGDGFILGVTENGFVSTFLKDPTGATRKVTSAQKRLQFLYIGSLEGHYIGVLEL